MQCITHNAKINALYIGKGQGQRAYRDEFRKGLQMKQNTLIEADASLYWSHFTTNLLTDGILLRLYFYHLDSITE